jgi:Flp pilus assembly protein TadD
VVDPENATAWNNLCLARAMAGGLEEAGPAFQKAANLAPDNLAFRRNLVNWYQKMGLQQEAESELPKMRIYENAAPR